MARVKRGVTKHARHKKILSAAKGARGRQKNTFRAAIQRVEKNRHAFFVYGELLRKEPTQLAEARTFRACARARRSPTTLYPRARRTCERDPIDILNWIDLNEIESN